MVERNGHDHRDRRPSDDIGRVISAAETDFYDRDIGRMLREKKESDGGQDFKDGNLLAAIRFCDAPHGVCEHRVADQSALAVLDAQAVALVPVHQMRRCVNVDAQARSLQNRTAEGRDRALAVRPRDVNDRGQALLWIAESGEQPRDPVEREVESFRVEGEKLLDLPRRLADLSRRHDGSPENDPAGAG